MTETIYNKFGGDPLSWDKENPKIGTNPKKGTVMVNDEATSNYLNRPVRSIMDAIADMARENGLSATSHPNGVVISGLVVRSFSVLQTIIDCHELPGRSNEAERKRHGEAVEQRRPTNTPDKEPK